IGYWLFVLCKGIPITNEQLPITNYQLPITNYPCPMPHAPCPLSTAADMNYEFANLPPLAVFPQVNSLPSS
ncbi:MAG TPA: hypothetical protein DD001_08895, partial [Microcoleaceae bacterium UBA10368]|nr:hypothetical protein [Microcoleaceae cyanobacterium UBA10368]